MHEWELQMEQLNHAEEGLFISPPASSQACCQLDPCLLSLVASSPSYTWQGTTKS